MPEEKYLLGKRLVYFTDKTYAHLDFTTVIYFGESIWLLASNGNVYNSANIVRMKED